MENLKHLKNMMNHRASQLEKESRKLARMAGASINIHERSALRNESRYLASKAKIIRTRYEKAFGTDHTEESCNGTKLAASVVA